MGSCRRTEKLTEKNILWGRNTGKEDRSQRCRGGMPEAVECKALTGISAYSWNRVSHCKQEEAHSLEST